MGFLDLLVAAPSQRLVDVSIGLSVLGWAAAGAWSGRGERPIAIVIVTTLLHLSVGILFFFRASPRQHGDLRTCLFAVPAVLVGGWVFRYSPSQWNSVSQILFAGGGSLAIISFAFLGRCFAILPAIRGTVTRGPFAVIRHPAYLGELLMVVACIIAAAGSWSGLSWNHVLILVVTLSLFVTRIRSEERLLLTSAAYQTYSRDTPWRLVPRFW